VLYGMPGTARRISTSLKQYRFVASFHPRPSGSTRIALTIDSLRTTQQILERIQAACRLDKLRIMP
jgi:hypothetical protein